MEKAIDIASIQSFFTNGMVFVTEHAAERIRERNISIKSIRFSVMNGEIIEQYPDDYPYPSCLILGFDECGKAMHICMSDEGSSSRIITAYYPDDALWKDGFKIRKGD